MTDWSESVKKHPIRVRVLIEADAGHHSLTVNYQTGGGHRTIPAKFTEQAAKAMEEFTKIAAERLIQEVIASVGRG